jgi:hypothetical protein
MGIGPFLVARLTADAGVSPIVGNNVFDITSLQDQAMPFIAFEEFDGERYSAMGADANICDARVRLHFWNKTVPERDTLITAVRKSLQRYNGTLANISVDDVFIVRGGPTLYDPQVRAWHAVRDYRIIYRES